MSDKLYRIGEAAALLSLKSYVLRFWETEFPQLEPVRTDKGQRLYTEEHVELLKLIKHLLHERGLTIDGARRILKSQAEELSVDGARRILKSQAEHMPSVNLLPNNPTASLPSVSPSALTANSSPAQQLVPQNIESGDFARPQPDAVYKNSSVFPSSHSASPSNALSGASSGDFSCAACAQTLKRAENAEEIARQYELLVDEFVLELQELKALLSPDVAQGAATLGQKPNETGEVNKNGEAAKAGEHTGSAFEDNRI